jgi:sarcosine oxidase, subunit beta
MPGGIYFRPQNRGQQILIGSVLEEDEREKVADPDAFATYVDDEFVHAKLHALQHRLRLGDIRGQVRGYSGLYTINRADMHPIVGATPVPGLYVANGCSGHGFKLAPAIGSLLAQAITGARRDFDTDVDPGFLAYSRDPIPLASMSVLA